MNAPQARPLGLVRDMPFEQYLAIDAMSQSGMRALSRSAWHYRNRAPVTPTKPMLRGTLAHCAQLEPHAMAQRYVVVPDDAPRRPTRAQWQAKSPSIESIRAMDWWTQFQASCVGREIVDAGDYAVTQAQLEAIRNEPYLAALFATGYGESSVFWVDPASGIYCKARPDWVHEHADGKTVTLIDLKTMPDESPDGFMRSAARLGFHRQRAHYRNGFRAATGKRVEEFVFAAVTNVPPVLAVPYALTDEVASQGEDEVAELLDLYARCLRDDRWPTYGTGLQIVDFPKWAKRSQEMEFEYADA